MMQFDRITLGKQARELDFVRDTFEKASMMVLCSKIQYP